MTGAESRSPTSNGLPIFWRDSRCEDLEQVFVALIDHGRSLMKVALYATILAMFYGFIYLADMKFGWEIMDYSNSAQTWFTPFYYSVVTYTTLGYGDVTANSLFGEILVISEVIVGYFTLGLLLAILANTIARRS